MEDLGAIPLLSWDDFQHYLPPACVDAHAIRASLQASGAICDNRWAVFPKTPAELPEHEDKVFIGMHEIFDAIVEECKKRLPGRAQTLSMANNPQQAPQYNERTNASRPDGALRLLTGLYEWVGIGVSKEFKKNVRDEYDVCAGPRLASVSWLTGAFTEHAQDYMEPASHNAGRSLPPFHLRYHDRE